MRRPRPLQRRRVWDYGTSSALSLHGNGVELTGRNTEKIASEYLGSSCSHTSEFFHHQLHRQLAEIEKRI